MKKADLNSREALSISNINLDNYDILINDIFVLSPTNERYQIFKLDFGSLFPEDSVNHYVFIKNKLFYRFQKVENATNNDYVYLSITKDRQNVKLKVCFGYKIKEKEYHVKCNLYLEIKVNGHVVYISKYQFKNFVRKFRKSPNLGNFFKIEKYPLECHALNSIKYYDKKGNCINFDKDNYTHQDTRRWLLHDGKFGTGKTTSDINFATKNQLEPVIISPWEDNYDQDILQLIYSRISKSHSPGIFSGLNGEKNIYIFMLVIIATLFTFFNNSIVIDLFDIICNKAKNIVDPYINFSDILSMLHLTGAELKRIISFISSIILSIYFLPSIILFKKDNTKYYQEFYIKKIQSIIRRNNKVFLIIEDVDRLDKDVYNEVFRILSLLNKELFNRDIIGIISLDENIIEKECNDITEIMNDKLIYRKIFNDYSDQKSMEIYLKDGFKFLNILKNNDINFSIPDEKIKQKEVKNFRAARKIIEDEIQLIKKENNR